VVAANNIGAAPVDLFLIPNPKKYPGDQGTTGNDEPPHPVNVFVSLLVAGQEKQYGPNQQEKKSNAIPVEIGMDSFNDDFHGHQK
jgi:hypothetical protein